MQVNNLIDFSKLTNGKLIFDYDLKKTNWFNIGGKGKTTMEQRRRKTI